MCRETIGDFGKRFVPSDARELALAFRASAAQRMQQTVWMIFALEIFGDFAAKKTARNGMIGVAGDLGGVAGRIYIKDHRAGVGAIEGTNGEFLAGHLFTSIAETPASYWVLGCIH